jgi:hypothetical protein
MVVALQMPLNRFVSYGKKTLVGAFGTIDFRFFADSPDPFIPAHWRIPGPTRLPAFETARVNIFAPTKQGAEEGDLGLGGGMLIHGTMRQVSKSERCVHKPTLHSHHPLGPSTIENRRKGSVTFPLSAGCTDLMAKIPTHNLTHKIRCLIRLPRTLAVPAVL